MVFWKKQIFIRFFKKILIWKLIFFVPEFTKPLKWLYTCPVYDVAIDHAISILRGVYWTKCFKRLWDLIKIPCYSSSDLNFFSKSPVIQCGVCTKLLNITWKSLLFNWQFIKTISNLVLFKGKHYFEINFVKRIWEYIISFF